MKRMIYFFSLLVLTIIVLCALSFFFPIFNKTVKIKYQRNTGPEIFLINKNDYLYFQGAKKDSVFEELTVNNVDIESMLPSFNSELTYVINGKLIKYATIDSVKVKYPVIEADYFMSWRKLLIVRLTFAIFSVFAGIIITLIARSIP